MRARIACIACALGAFLAACEQPQTATTRRADQKPWQGADAAYVQPGWAAGDRASWEAQLRTRAQAQNEYAKVR